MFADMPPEQRLYLADRLLCRLAMREAQATISALPAAEAEAIMAAIQTLDLEYREVRRRMRALATPVDAVLARLPGALWVDPGHLGGQR